MLKKIRIVFLVAFAVLLLTNAANAAASQPAPPEPPIENPHPPVTDADKRRVAFAEEVINNLLMKPPVLEEKAIAVASPWFYNPAVNLNIDETCLKNKECLLNNAALKEHLASFIKTYISLKSYKHVHIIPWSYSRFKNQSPAPQKPLPRTLLKEGASAYTESDVSKNESTMTAPNLASDEYMFHAYVQFGKSNAWHHLDIIVTEDAKGNLTLRRFFIVPMPHHERDLPLGVVC